MGKGLRTEQLVQLNKMPLKNRDHRYTYNPAQMPKATAF